EPARARRGALLVVPRAHRRERPARRGRSPARERRARAARRARSGGTPYVPSARAREGARAERADAHGRGAAGGGALSGRLSDPHPALGVDRRNAGGSGGFDVRGAQAVLDPSTSGARAVSASIPTTTSSAPQSSQAK